MRFLFCARAIGRISILAALPLATLTVGQAPIRIERGAGPQDAFGHRVVRLLDVNKDGVDDWAVGSPGAAANGVQSGAVHVYSGRDAKLLHLFFGADREDRFGYALASAGDLDQDGYGDLLIGAPGDSPPGWTGASAPGSVQVLSGRDGKIVFTWFGDNSGDATGRSVAAIGDIDRDRVPDLAIGSPFYDHKGTQDCGRVELRSGKSGKVLRQLFGRNPGERFGWSLATLSASRRFGQRLLAIGAEGGTEEGASGSVYLVDTKRGRIVRQLALGEEHDYFGGHVADLGDLDGDGDSELGVGAWNATVGDVRGGLVIAYSIKTGRELWRYGGRALHDRCGLALAGMGDLDRDGVRDVAIGIPQDSVRGIGKVAVVSGSTGATLLELVGEAEGDHFGDALSALGDRDTDGLPDLAIGIPGAMGGRGEVRIQGSLTLRRKIQSSSPKPAPATTPAAPKTGKRK